VTAPDLEAVADLCAFIDASPSPYHAVDSAGALLDVAGFTPLDERDEWGDPSGSHYVVREGSLVAWSVPSDADPASPWRLIGAHTDSPNLRVKPRPDIGTAGARQLGVEVYGGALLNSWLDRDLGLSGRVGLRGGDTALVLVDRPLLRIPQLAIHLDRDISASGLLLNPQTHLMPVWGIGQPDVDGFRAFLAGELGVAADDVLAWEVMLHDITPSRLIGRDDELLSAPRLDNLCSCWAATRALTTGDAPAAPAMVVLFDHEEIGSTSREGAGSTIVQAVLERVVDGLGGGVEALRRALAGSVCASADMAHATHPNYPERHDPAHWIALGGGPVIKTNASQRYASDAYSSAVFAEACERAGVPVQQFVSRNDMPCGSTIGPITAARLGIATVDVGAPQLAMHAARELTSAADPGMFAAALAAFLRP
jgi:aspartyl aminopeptidase